MSPDYFSLLFSLNGTENKCYMVKIDVMKLSLRSEKRIIPSVNISYLKLIFMIFLLNFRVD